MDSHVLQYKSLSSEKYYVEKLEAEAKAYRRQHAGQSIKTFFAYTMMFGIFAVGGYMLYATDFVPQSIDYMRANGILSF